MLKLSFANHFWSSPCMEMKGITVILLISLAVINAAPAGSLNKETGVAVKHALSQSNIHSVTSEKILLLPPYLLQQVEKARNGLLSTDQINSLISHVSVYPGNEAIVSELTLLMLEAAKPNTRSFTDLIGPDLQQQVEKARKGLLSTDQINSLISHVSIYSGTEALVSELTLLMLEAAKPRFLRVDPPLPAYLQEQVAKARKHQLTSDQINTLISQVSVYPGTGPLVSELAQLMLDAATLQSRSVLPNLPAYIEELIEKARKLELTSDQINALISLVSVFDGTGVLVGELTNLMLVVALPRSFVQPRLLDGFMDIVTTLLSLVDSTAENTYVAVSTLVSDFIDNTVAVTGFAIETVADIFLGLLRPFRFLLGSLYNQIIEVVNNIVNRPDSSRYIF